LDEKKKGKNPRTGEAKEKKGWALGGKKMTPKTKSRVQKASATGSRGDPE